MPKNSRAKGARGELEVVELLGQVPGWEPRRGIQSRTGGDASDIEDTPYHIEVKLSKEGEHKGSPEFAMKQGLRDTNGRPVLAFTRRTPPKGKKAGPKRWLVTMEASTFIAMQLALQTLLREREFERKAAEQLAKGHKPIVDTEAIKRLADLIKDRPQPVTAPWVQPRPVPNGSMILMYGGAPTVEE